MPDCANNTGAKSLSPVVHPVISYYVADCSDSKSELLTGLDSRQAVNKYVETMNKAMTYPLIGIEMHDDLAGIFSLKGGLGPYIYDGSNINDAPLHDRYLRKIPEFVDGIKELTRVLMASGCPVHNGKVFLDEYKDIISVNGIQYKSYYNSLNTREICHDISSDESRKKSDAIQIMAEWFINQNIVTDDDILIPSPQHTGRAEYTLAVAELVSEKTGARIADVLRCTPREPLYMQKKAGRQVLETTLYLDGKIPENHRLFLVDNVISTGATFNKAKSLIPDIIPLVYALTGNANLSFRNNRYYAGYQAEQDHLTDKGHCRHKKHEDYMGR